MKIKVIPFSLCSREVIHGSSFEYSILREKSRLFRSCLKFFLRTFETGFRAGFCRFLRRIAALFYDKNGENVPEGCHKELLKKF